MLLLAHSVFFQEAIVADGLNARLIETDNEIVEVERSLTSMHKKSNEMRYLERH
jgi:hypothetical protein